MDSSGHSVCNDKQEKNIWMFVYTIVYLKGKLKVFWKFTVSLGESWKDFKDGQTISSETIHEQGFTSRHFVGTEISMFL